MEMNRIDAQTCLYAIFGKPVRHSFSPRMHNAAFRECGVNAAYLAFEPSSIEDAVKAVRALNIMGASVTIPFKVEVKKLCDRLDPLAERIGAVNTLLYDNGIITGYNTDGTGALKALSQGGIDPAEGTVLILGNGGAARAIAFTLSGINTQIVIAGRNRGRIESLTRDLNNTGGNASSILIDEINQSFIRHIDIIINTTSVGMSPETGSIPIKKDLIRKEHTVFDIIYAPNETMLLKTAENLGCRTVRGIEMLINQGAEQFELWTGKPAPIDIMRSIITEHVKSNV